MSGRVSGGRGGNPIVLAAERVACWADADAGAVRVRIGVREATADDWPAIRPFFHTIVAAGDTFTYPRDLGEEEARGWWLPPAPNRTVAAGDDGTGAVLGTARMSNHQSGDGAHMAGAGCMADPAHRRPGRGPGAGRVHPEVGARRGLPGHAVQRGRGDEHPRTRYRSANGAVSGSSAPSRRPSTTPSRGRGAAHHAPSAVADPAVGGASGGTVRARRGRSRRSSSAPCARAIGRAIARPRPEPGQGARRFGTVEAVEDAREVLVRDTGTVAPVWDRRRGRRAS